MVIKALALELYRAQQTVHKLQDQLEKATLADKERIKEELRVASAECRLLRRMVEGKKQKPLFRTSFNDGPKIS
jgi:hypothetical protein